MRPNIFALSFSTLWLAGIILAPILKHFGWDSSYLYLIYSNICHQDPARSFFLFQEKLGVCSRCTGIYTGLFLFSLQYPLWRPRLNLKNIIFLTIPLVLGKILEKALGFSSNIERFLTGIFLGILLGMGLSYGLEKQEVR